MTKKLKVWLCEICGVVYDSNTKKFPVGTKVRRGYERVNRKTKKSTWIGADKKPFTKKDVGVTGMHCKKKVCVDRFWKKMNR